MQIKSALQVNLKMAAILLDLFYQIFKVTILLIQSICVAKIDSDSYSVMHRNNFECLVTVIDTFTLYNSP